MSRDIRRLVNSTEQPQTFNIGSPSSLQEGGTFVTIENGNLAVYRKHKGINWKNYMSRNGNQIIDNKLKAKHLEYGNKFVDYRSFIHNFELNLGGTKIYVPWHGSGEQSDMLDERTAYLVPFTMTCHKILFRPSDISTVATDIVFTIEKATDGSTSTSVVSTFDATESWSATDGTMFTVNQSDWDNIPRVVKGEVVGIGINPDDTNITTGTEQFHITSVWRIEVTI
tara:strand:+ start:1977 stop:2654 length:678 start_codon:yes stop_codon:yes gene_type:complete